MEEKKVLVSNNITKTLIITSFKPAEHYNTSTHVKVTNSFIASLGLCIFNQNIFVFVTKLFF